MKSGPAFTIDGDIITETKTGSTGRVIKRGDSYLVQELEYKGKPGKQQALYARMTSWHYFSQVKK